MYKAIVVDDEPKVRRGLTALIPQLDGEWSVVGEARDGREALETIKREMPDLVFTDIRMPHMNGLDLLSELKEYPVHVAILSGYGYFEYAQTAVRYGAFDYLLKPIKPDEIREVLSKVKAERRTMPAEAHREPGHPSYSGLWQDWLTGTQDDQSPPKQLSSLHDGRLTDFRVLALEVDNLDDLMTEDQWGDRQLVLFAVRNILHDVVSVRPAKAYYLFADGPQIYFLLANEREAVAVAKAIIDNVGKWLRMSVSAGISDASDSFAGLPALWRHAREALRNKWIYGCGTVSDYGEWQMEDVLAAGYPNHLDERLALAVRNGQREEALACLRAFIGEVKRMNAPFKLFRRFCLQLVSSAIRITYELKIYELVLARLSNAFELFDMDFTSDEFVAFMTEWIDACIASAEWKRAQKSNQTIEKAMAFIQAHYAEDLSLEETAAQAQMNPSYFSTFFKAETGTTFIEHVTSLRLEKAKMLMMNPQLRLYEIAQMVGYQEVKYFSRIFKKKMGVTPAEYRQFFYQKEG